MRRIIASFFIAMTLAGSVSAGQPAGGDFVLVKSTIDGGGGTSVGGGFVLTGTIGQADAGTQIASSADFSLAGGFWARIGNVVLELIFKDGFEGG